MARRIPDNARQIAILVVRARFGAAYEIYAHEAVAVDTHKMSGQRIATLVSGSRPGDLSDEEGAAYDVAHALVNGGILPEPTYRCALGLFGQAGLNELIYLVGHYCFVSVTLNGFDIPVPANSKKDTGLASSMSWLRFHSFLSIGGRLRGVLLNRSKCERLKGPTKTFKTQEISGSDLPAPRQMGGQPRKVSKLRWCASSPSGESAFVNPVDIK